MNEDLGEELEKIRLLLENYISETEWEAFEGYVSDRKAMNVGDEE